MIMSEIVPILSKETVLYFIQDASIKIASKNYIKE